jgi:hypothetical protein
VRVNITDWPYSVEGEIHNIGETWNEFRIAFDSDVEYPLDFASGFKKYFILEFEGGGIGMDYGFDYNLLSYHSRMIRIHV